MDVKHLLITAGITLAVMAIVARVQALSNIVYNVSV